MVDTQPDIDPLGNMLKEYQENSWVRKLSRDYRERKQNLEKTGNSEQLLKIISLLKERIVSDNAVRAAENETQKTLAAKVAGLEAEKDRLESTVSGLYACLDLLKKRGENSKRIIQRLSAEVQQYRENAREYRVLKKMLNVEKKARLSLDEHYRSLVESKGLNLKTLETLSEKYNGTLQLSAQDMADKLKDGKEDAILTDASDEIISEDARKYENFDETEADDMAEFSKMLIFDIKPKVNKLKTTNK